MSQFKNPVFLGLTRPSMFLGVSADYFGLGFMLALSLFILTADPWILVGWVPYHLAGWIACQVEPRFFRLLIKALQCGYSRNQTWWRCRVYEPF